MISRSHQALIFSLLLSFGASCRREAFSLAGMPCDFRDPGHLCLTGYVCNQDLRCARFISPNCQDPSRCPSLAAGLPCPSEGALLPCEDDAITCTKDGGCMVCGEDGLWSGCRTDACLLGELRSCGACDDDCAAEGRILNAEPTPAASIHKRGCWRAATSPASPALRTWT